MAEYVVAQASVLIVPSLEGFQKELKAELKAIQAELRRNALEVDVKPKGITKMLGEIELAKQAAEEDPIKIRVDTVNVMKKLTEIRHKYEDLGRDMKKALVLDLKIAGMSLLPQLAQGLAAANASMVQLVQSGLLLPGILSGAASSILTIVTGLGGVGAAFKEYSDAQKNAAQNGLQARNAALNVQNAYRDLGRSIKDAQRNLEDLNAQLRDAPLDEADAIIRVQEAIAEAADKAGKSGLQQQKDALALTRAENDLVNTRLRNSRLIQDVAEANAKGVAGADAVREATDRLSKAQDDAATKSAKLSDSLKLISPNAQKFVEAVTGMNSEWTKFRNSVQDRLFSGLDQEIAALANNSLPMLSKGFGAIADSVNKNVKTAFEVFQKPENKGLLENILGNTADAQAKMSKAIEPFVDGFLKLSQVGATFLPRLVDGLAQVMQRFENFVNVADKNGSLEKWINDGIDALAALGNAVLNLGSIFTSISDAFTGSGGKGMLQVLDDASERLADFLKSDKGQQKLIQFFNDARMQLAQWKPLLNELPGMFASLSDASKRVAEVLLPFLTTAATLLKNHPAFVSAAIQAYVGFKTIGPIVKGVNKLLDTELVGTLKKIPSTIMSSYNAFGGLSLSGSRAAGTLSQSFKNMGASIKNSIVETIGPGGLAMGALSGIVSYLTYQYVQAQSEAAEAASAHADALREIATQVDQVTGKLTQSGLVDQLKKLSQYSNINLTGNPVFDLPSEAQRLGIASTNQIAQALLPSAEGQAAFDDIQRKNEQIVRDAVKASPYYTTNTALLNGKGITLDDLVKAVLGDAAAAEKLNNASVGFNASDLIQGRQKLLGSEPGLGETATIAANLNKALTEQRRNTSSESSRVAAAVQATAGTATMKPGTVLDRLGNPVAYPLDDGSGGIKISVDTPYDKIQVEFPNLLKKITEQGGSVSADSVGSTITFRDPNVANQYADIQKRASGGLIYGPGTGTSDSILVGLSSGEYVVNAKSTRKHLPLLESINGGGVPGFYGGGVVPLFPLSPTPSPPPPGPGSLIQTNNWAAEPAQPVFGPGPLVGGNAAASGNSADPSAPNPIVPFRPPIGSGTDVPNPVAPNPSAPKPLGDIPASDTTDSSSVSAPVSGGTVPTSTDSRVNPNTSVHGASGASPGPGNPIPNIASPTNMPASPGPVVPYAPMASGPMPGIPGVAPTQVEAVPGVTPEVNFGATEAARYGLRVSSGLRPGETGSYHAIGQAGDYSNQKQFGPPTPEMTAFANDIIAKYTPYISELIYAGVSQNIIDGKLVPAIDMPGSPYNTGRAGYHGDHVHIAWKPGVLEQLAGSPSNMPMAMTPTGVALPQLTYTGSGTLGDNNSSSSGLRLPTPEEYAKYVSDSWMGTLQNLVQNAGRIAMNFVGSFFGIDLSKITGLANSVMSGIDLPDSKKGKGGDSGSNLPGLPEIDQIISASQQLPPQYQQAYLDAASQNPAQAGSMLQQLLQSLGATAGSAPSGDIQGWLYGQLLSNGLTPDQARGILAMNAVEGGAKDTKSLLGFTESQARGPQAHVAAFMKQWNDMSRRPGGKIPGVAADGSVSDWNAYMSWIRVKIVGQTGVQSDWQGNPQPNPNDYQARLMQALATGGNFTPWNGAAWPSGKKPPGFAGGGNIRGRGNGRSDSIIARVSNGEYIVRAPMAQKHLGLLNAINSNKLPGFADGGQAVNPLFPPPPPPPVPPVTTPTPPPAPVPPDPMGPQAAADAGQPTAPAPVTNNVGPGDQASTTLQDVGATLGQVGEAISGVADGATAPAGGDPTGDPRSVLADAPQNLDHNKPAVSAGIQAAGSAISGAINTAVQAAAAAGTFGAGAPAAGAAAGSAGGIISGLVSAGAGAVSGAVNILSSLGVGTVTPTNSTAGAYGAPLLPQEMGQQPYTGPQVVNNWNGGVHTSNNEEFYKLQQRRELQNAAPFLPQR